MLLNVFGTPSALMYGGLNLVRNFTDLELGSHKLANANTTSEFRNAVSQVGPNDARVVFYSDLPDPDLCALFIKARAPIVLFVDDFDDVVGYLRASREMSLHDGVRLASRSFCALEPFIRSDLALKLGPKAYARGLQDILADIGTFFGRPLPQKQKEVVARSLVDRREKPTFFDYLVQAFPHASKPGAALLKMHTEEQRLVRQLSQAYSAIANGRNLNGMDWPIGMLMDSATAGGPFSGRVELLGPARFLAYGPYLHLTPGNWLADVVFEIKENYSGNILYADVYSGEILSVVTTPLPLEGTYKFRIYFQISNALEPVQLRFQTLSGAIEGVIVLNHIQIQRNG